jgi:hypothetical protein
MSVDIGGGSESRPGDEVTTANGFEYTVPGTLELVRRVVSLWWG